MSPFVPNSVMARRIPTTLSAVVEYRSGNPLLISKPFKGRNRATENDDIHHSVPFLGISDLIPSQISLLTFCGSFDVWLGEQKLLLLAQVGAAFSWILDSPIWPYILLN